MNRLAPGEGGVITSRQLDRTDHDLVLESVEPELKRQRRSELPISCSEGVSEVRAERDVRELALVPVSFELDRDHVDLRTRSVFDSANAVEPARAGGRYV